MCRCVCVSDFSSSCHRTLNFGMQVDECFEVALRVFQQSFQGILKQFKGNFNEDSKAFKKRSKEILMGVQKCFMRDFYVSWGSNNSTPPLPCKIFQPF